MPAYMIFTFTVIDPSTYGSYVSQVGPMLLQSGANVLVVSHEAKIMEGSTPKMNVVIEFASAEKALEFYNSPAYAPLKDLRLKATADHSCVIAPGFFMPAR